ncbi:transglycosylase family protein [Streptomyces paludis]|uniref:transglycosylase family protein n=1 Tax=Streptomyces paludis TaxID=2282738 RepID=UPI0015F2D7C2|nr:transglycosylase family protein [Streptomyces paludis]
MRSGKHRRPRQAPALLVAAGVTGSAIAIPLLAASGASAAEASTWDRVAECESGGRWSANLGNGFYGGLQLTQETWDTFGGAEFAASPDLASRSRQIQIADKVFAAQGTKAWSSCAVVSGLVKSVGGVVDGATGTGSDSATTDPAAGATDGASGTETPGYGDSGTQTGGTAPSATTTPSPAASDAKESATPEADASSAPAKGKHRGAPAKEDDGASGNTDKEREPNDRASRGSATARDGSLGDAYGGEETGRGESVVVGGEPLSVVIGSQKVVGGWV